MSRSGIPTIAQQEMLLGFFEEKRWLATSFARTAYARHRTRVAWQEIARKLNGSCNGQGAIKSWQQWAKYWKDKKAALKRKYSQITGRQASDTDEVVSLSEVEQHMLSIVGVEHFASCDADLELAAQAGLTSHALPPVYKSERNDPMEENGEGGEGDDSNRLDPPHPPPRVTMSVGNGRVVVAAGAARRRPSGTRRLQPAPAPRRTLMATLTERFVAIEERRVENEAVLAQTQQEMVQVLRTMSKAWLKQSQALQELANKLPAESS